MTDAPFSLSSSLNIGEELNPCRFLYCSLMEFPPELASKWVAIKKDRFIDSGKNLKMLMGRMKKREDRAQIGYSFVPHGALLFSGSVR